MNNTIRITVTTHTTEQKAIESMSAAQERDADHKLRKKEVIAEGFKNKTKGEALFNGFSYIGIGYFLVTATSVFMSWLLNDSAILSKRFRGFVEGAAKNHGINPTITNIATLFIGGTIASVLPVKWLENKKPEIVEKLDKVLYTDEQLANDPKIAQAHQELREMPKQTWSSVMGSRIVAFVATLAVFFALGSSTSPLQKKFGVAIDTVAVRFARWADKALHRGAPEIIKDITEAEKLNALRSATRDTQGKLLANGPQLMRDAESIGTGNDRIMTRNFAYIAMDMIYTVFTSASLFIFTRVFGGLFGNETGSTTQTHAHANPKNPSPTAADASAKAAPSPSPTQPTADKPGTQVGQKVHMERLTTPARELEVTT